MKRAVVWANTGHIDREWYFTIFDDPEEAESVYRAALNAQQAAHSPQVYPIDG